MVDRRQDAPMVYVARRPPAGEAELGSYVHQELSLIAHALMACRTLVVPLCHVAPEKPVAGQLVRADGTYWDPGGGPGYYCYHDGQWRRWTIEPGDEANREKTDKDVGDGENHDDHRTVE